MINKMDKKIYTSSIIDNPCVMEIINFYKKEFKESLEKALKPFMVDLKTPIQIIFNFGETK